MIYPKGTSTCVLYADFSLDMMNMRVKEYLNHLCLSHGTTWEGCYQASCILLKGCYKRPICIDSTIYFPTHSPSFEQCVWINLSFMNHCSLEQLGSWIHQDLNTNKMKKQIYEATRLKSILECYNIDPS